MTPATQRTAAGGLEDPDLFMAMDDLELVAHGVVEGALHGLHRSPHVGFSVEFDTHRDYQPGDDLRHVNWNLWARTDRLYVKEFTADTNLTLYLLVDATASMLCEHGPATKWRYGARAAAALAYLALHGHDAVGLYLLGDHLREEVHAALRPGQFHRVLAGLQNVVPAGAGDLATALDESLSVCQRRGLVVLVSDLLEDQDDRLLAGLRHLRSYGHGVIVMQVLDPWEVDLPERGQFEFRDLERGNRLRTEVAAVRDAYREAVRAWREGWRQQCEESGIEWVSCRTSDPLQALLVDYLVQRARLF